jgi:hypothetical protein
MGFDRLPEFEWIGEKLSPDGKRNQYREIECVHDEARYVVAIDMPDDLPAIPGDMDNSLQSSVLNSQPKPVELYRRCKGWSINGDVLIIISDALQTVYPEFFRKM